MLVTGSQRGGRYRSRIVRNISRPPTLIRTKPEVADVVRLSGEFDHEGQQVYVVKTANVMSAQAPNQHLRDPEDEGKGIWWSTLLRHKHPQESNITLGQTLLIRW